MQDASQHRLGLTFLRSDQPALLQLPHQAHDGAYSMLLFPRALPVRCTLCACVIIFFLVYSAKTAA
jgi:hypothetical protein